MCGGFCRKNFASLWIKYFFTRTFFLWWYNAFIRLFMTPKKLETFFRLLVLLYYEWFVWKHLFVLFSIVGDGCGSGGGGCNFIFFSVWSSAFYNQMNGILQIIYFKIYFCSFFSLILISDIFCSKIQTWLIFCIFFLLLCNYINIFLCNILKLSLTN